MGTLRGLLGFLLLSIALLGPSVSMANTTAWQAVQEGGQVILMRHALAPGVGDPDNFERGNCSTQRNLSDQGRAQAVAIGDAFRARSIPIDAVYSSHWCRVRETAELMALGEVQTVNWLDSFFIASERHAREQRTRDARQRILDWQGPGNLLLVTHQVNITALVGGGVASGDMVVVQPEDGELTVIGRLTDVR
ncbi:histidine phosphatase family protein [Vreelandella aquamarina]|uniref:histidine phosphatase family protein n=1 Tax=Vreelandella aquamarina TaxID=77097 RepID=UPI00384A8F18